MDKLYFIFVVVFLFAGATKINGLYSNLNVFLLIGMLKNLDSNIIEIISGDYEKGTLPTPEHCGFSSNSVHGRHTKIIGGKPAKNGIP